MKLTLNELLLLPEDKFEEAKLSLFDLSLKELKALFKDVKERKEEVLNDINS